jgi:hypothetical protein
VNEPGSSTHRAETSLNDHEAHLGGKRHKSTGDKQPAKLLTRSCVNKKSQAKRTIPELPLNKMLKLTGNPPQPIQRITRKKKPQLKMVPVDLVDDSDSIHISDDDEEDQQVDHAIASEDFLLEVVLPCIPSQERG